MNKERGSDFLYVNESHIDKRCINAKEQQRAEVAKCGEGGELSRVMPQVKLSLYCLLTVFIWLARGSGCFGLHTPIVHLFCGMKIIESRLSWRLFQKPMGVWQPYVYHDEFCLSVLFAMRKRVSIVFGLDLIEFGLPGFVSPRCMRETLWPV